MSEPSSQKDWACATYAGRFTNRACDRQLFRRYCKASPHLRVVRVRTALPTSDVRHGEPPTSTPCEHSAVNSGNSWTGTSRSHDTARTHRREPLFYQLLAYFQNFVFSYIINNVSTIILLWTFTIILII